MFASPRLGGHTRVALAALSSASALAAVSSSSAPTATARGAATGTQTNKVCIAVVGATSGPAFDRMPAELRARVDLVRVDCASAEALEAQAPQLAKATGLLWIPTKGNLSGGTPSETLAQVWPKLPKVAWVSLRPRAVRPSAVRAYHISPSIAPCFHVM
jgi:hypothetical protein